MDKRFITILAIVILSLVGLFYIFKDNSASNNIGIISQHTKGNNAKNIEIMVYGDFECSACVQYFYIEKQIAEKYYDNIAFTFRHFPLDGSHPNARASSRAAEAAGLQDKFFEMHNLLYEQQNNWASLSNPYPAFEQIAQSLGLDMDKFKNDFKSETVNSTINADYQAGVEQGVDSTPTYFLNGEKLNNADAINVDKFSSIIEQAIQDSDDKNSN